MCHKHVVGQVGQEGTMRAKRAGGLAGRLTRLEADAGQTDQRAPAAVELWLPSHHRGGLQPGTYEQYSGTATLVVYTRLARAPSPRRRS